MHSIRKFTVVTLFCSAIILFITALVLFFAPGSREAAAIGWNFIGIDKPAFKLMHKIFGVTMALAALTHMCINRKALAAYIKNAAGKCPVSRSARWSFILIILLFAASIYFSR